jgi:hypothetical protein
MSDDHSEPIKPKTIGARPGVRRTSTNPYLSIEEAAPRLGMTVQALRARCRRGVVKEGRETRCYLGDGVVASKFGRTWRLRFPT